MPVNTNLGGTRTKKDSSFTEARQMTLFTGPLCIDFAFLKHKFQK